MSVEHRISSPDMAARYVHSEATFGLVVRFDLLEGHEEAFDDLTAETVSKICENEPRTLLYLTNSVEGEPLARVFFELYFDKGAFDEHERAPHMRRFLEERREHLREDPLVWFVSPLGGFAHDVGARGVS